MSCLLSVFRNSLAPCVLGVAVLALLGGCSRTDIYPATTPVTLTITYQGEPVEGATVILISEEGTQPMAKGLTDATGVAKPRTFPEVPGVLPGKYIVVVHKRKFEPPPTAGLAQDLPPEVTYIDLLPAKYGDKDRSSLRVDVPAAGSVTEQINLAD
ncbi:MAG: hypothetical protein NZ899_11620 [Thermoguttaceae bacterium]|nr:hypothetical protein [Thermoguttaceae bacterium]MDW8079513.1 hypothetical protein [Thermoguttaceae bacterium]